MVSEAVIEDGKLYLSVDSPTIKNKTVQVRPWLNSDSDYVMDESESLDPRKTIFVGGVPRPLTAKELAQAMNEMYGNVCYAGIDTDPELKYPKGAGRVAFSDQRSYVSAISSRFVQLKHNKQDIDKRVEVKPYVLDDQLCDHCSGKRNNGKFAPYFCATVSCLQYYCEFCWKTVHATANKSKHQPMIKEGSEKEALLANFNYFNNPTGMPTAAAAGPSGTEYIPHFSPQTQMYYGPGMVPGMGGAAYRYPAPEHTMHTTQIVNPYMVGKYPNHNPYNPYQPNFYGAHPHAAPHAAAHLPPPRLDPDYMLRQRHANPYGAPAPHYQGAPNAMAPGQPGADHHNKENINRLYDPKAMHAGSTPNLKDAAWKNMTLHQAAAAHAWQTSKQQQYGVPEDGRVKLGHVSSGYQGGFQAHSTPNLVARPPYGAPQHLG